MRDNVQKLWMTADMDAEGISVKTEDHMNDGL